MDVLQITCVFNLMLLGLYIMRYTIKPRYFMKLGFLLTYFSLVLKLFSLLMVTNILKVNKLVWLELFFFQTQISALCRSHEKLDILLRGITEATLHNK